MQTFVEDDPPDRTDPFPGLMIDRAAFDASLVAEAQRAGADCRFGTRAAGIERDGRVRLADGSCWAPKVIIGADGPRSLAGRSIGQANRALVETRQVTVALEGSHDSTDIFLSARIPGGYGWVFPKGDIAHVGAGVDPVHKVRLKAIVDELHALLARRGRVGRGVLSRTGGAIPVGGMVEPWGTLGEALVLLAGDAAGLAHPVMGAGIAPAVHSGRLAGEAAAAAIAGDRAACLDYEDELDAVFGAAWSRAVIRRRELLASSNDKRALRRAWIAYPGYWEPP
jgi:flavin-dependent dehydrogenase